MATQKQKSAWSMSDILLFYPNLIGKCLASKTSGYLRIALLVFAVPFFNTSNSGLFIFMYFSSKLRVTSVSKS
jgi:hypothetical protein